MIKNRKGKSVRNEILAKNEGYFVDDFGNIYGKRGTKLKGSIDNRGYPRFKVGKFGPSVSVHRLAAYQWFGDRLFEEGIEVRHLDANPANNSKTNIAIGTTSQNAMDKKPEIRLKVARKAAMMIRKLTNEEVGALRKDRNNGMSYKQLQIKYKLAKSTISYIVNKKTYNY